MDAFDGITNVATTVPCVESDMLLPLIVPIVALVIGAFAGGQGGELGSVMVTMTVAPRFALPPGATEPEPKMVVPALSKFATAVRSTR